MTRSARTHAFLPSSSRPTTDASIQVPEASVAEHLFRGGASLALALALALVPTRPARGIALSGAGDVSVLGLALPAPDGGASDVDALALEPELEPEPEPEPSTLAPAPPAAAPGLFSNLTSSPLEALQRARRALELENQIFRDTGMQTTTRADQGGLRKSYYVPAEGTQQFAENLASAPAFPMGARLAPLLRDLPGYPVQVDLWIDPATQAVTGATTVVGGSWAKNVKLQPGLANVLFNTDGAQEALPGVLERWNAARVGREGAASSPLFEVTRTEERLVNGRWVTMARTSGRPVLDGERQEIRVPFRTSSQASAGRRGQQAGAIGGGTVSLRPRLDEGGLRLETRIESSIQPWTDRVFGARIATGGVERGFRTLAPAEARGALRTMFPGVPLQLHPETEVRGGNYHRLDATVPLGTLLPGVEVRKLSMDRDWINVQVGMDPLRLP